MIDYAINALQEIGFEDGSKYTAEQIDMAIANIKTEYAAKGIQLDNIGARAELAMEYYGDILKADTKTNRAACQREAELYKSYH